MLISKIRDNTQSLFIKAFVGVIILSFALFGVDAVFNISSNDQEVAKVNGEKINQSDYYRAAEMLKRQVLSNLGENADPSSVDDSLIQAQALDSLIQQRLLLQSAEEQGIYIAEQIIDQQILNTEDFKVGDQFDPELYKHLLRNVGLTPRQYKEEVRSSMELQQLQSGVAQSAFITTSDLNNILRLDRQTRDIRFFTISAQSFADQVTVSNDEIDRFYDLNQNNFMTEEQVSIEYLELKRTDYFDQVEIDQAELQEQYEEYIANLGDNEERQASHILVEISDDRDESAAQERIQEVLDKLAQGESFAELAKTYSDDVGSAQDGGDLGYASRGAYVPAFEDALFAMQTGERSDVVKTEFGLHIIELQAIKKPPVPSLAELEDELREGIKYSKSEALFVAGSETLANESYAADDLESPASVTGLQIQKLGPFSRTTATGIAANGQVVATAFNAELIEQGNNSDIVEISRDHVVVIRVSEHKPKSVKPLDAVREDITDTLRQQAAEDQSAQAAETAAAAIKAGESITLVAEKDGFSLNTENQARRNQSGIDPLVLTEAFALAKPQDESATPVVSTVRLASGDYAVLQLDGVNQPADVNYEENELRLLGNFLSNQKGQLEFLELQKTLEDTAKINRSL